MSPTHEFVVVAYRHSPHLATCLDSLASQSRPSSITISTSTPFDGLEQLSSRYGARLAVHSRKGIGADWNAAIDAAGADLVTLAHQDDLYRPHFASTAVAMHAISPGAGFSFCDFNEIDNHGNEAQTFPRHIKKLLIEAAFFGCSSLNGGWRRRILLGFGNPIICPGVTLNRRMVAGFRFREDMRTNMDWCAWLDLSKRLPVVLIRKRLVDRRVHLESTTTTCIDDGSRYSEDLQIFRMLWPAPVSTLIANAYRASYRSYLP